MDKFQNINYLASHLSSCVHRCLSGMGLIRPAVSRPTWAALIEVQVYLAPAKLASTGSSASARPDASSFVP